MKISCPSCTAKYSIADDKVQNRLAKIRCRKCGTTIVIDGKTDPPVVRAADGGKEDEEPAPGSAHGLASIAPKPDLVHAAGRQATSGAAAVVYTVDVADNDQRSLTVDQIVAAYNDGTITADTYVWREGMGDWEPLADVDELNRALHEAAAAAAAPRAAEPIASAGSFSLGGGGPRASTGGLFGGSGAEPARAATRGEVSKDLFGSIDMAGGEYDSRTAEQEQIKAAAATGARNESSVLFSLSALTSGPDPVAPGRGAKARNDDSGLIDLAALASLAATNASRETAGHLAHGDTSAAAASPLTAPLGLPPLTVGGASPLGGVEVPKPANTNRGAMYIGGGIAIAAVVAALAYVLKEDPPAIAIAPAPVVTAPAAPTGPDPAAAAAAGEAETAKEAEGKADKADDTKPDTAKGPSTPRVQHAVKRAPSGGGNTGASVAKSGGGESSGASAGGGGGGDKPAAAAPPKKKCNCSPSDLMCAMRCSAK